VTDLDPEFARDCARRIVESQIIAIKQEPPQLWDICPDAYKLIKDDDDARDALWNAVCDELEDVEVTYTLKGENAADARRRRLEVEADRARNALLVAQGRFDAANHELREAQRADGATG
jgi:hypothetical protein